MTVVPGYRILGEIGAGASGVVYRAEQEGLSRTVALKVLSPGLFDEEATRARFLREGKLQARLSHPRLLALYDAGIAGGRPYLAMELVEGGSLRELLAREGALSAERAAGLAAGVAEGLAEAHRAGIVHRDLKPENVLLAGGQEVKVADFGLAKAYSESQTVRTATGVILGTPGYVAPEAIQGELSGPPADIYALGVILYEMLAGRRPFEGPSVAAVLTAQLAGRPTPLVQVRPDLPGWLERLTMDCLERDPGLRPVPALLASKLVAAWVPGRVTVVGASTARTAVRDPERAPKRVAWTGMAFGVGIGLGVAGLWSAWRQPPGAGFASRPSGAGSVESVTPSSPSTGIPASIGLLPVAVGANRVRFSFDAPLARGASVTLETTGGPQKVALTGGGPDYELTGLEPGRAYRGRIEAGGASVPVSMTTLDWPARSCAPILGVDANLGSAEIAVSQYTNTVAVAWNGTGTGKLEPGAIYLRTSPDMGATWWPVRKFGGGEYKSYSISLLATRQQTWLGWVQTPVLTGSSSLSVLEMGSPSSGASIRLNTPLQPHPGETRGFRSMSLAGGETAAPGLAACIGSRFDGSHDIGFATLMPGLQELPSWSHVTVLPDHREIRLVSDPPRTHLFAVTATPDKIDQLLWTWGIGSDPKSWRPVRKITAAGDSVTSFTGCTREKHVLIAYSASTMVWTQRVTADPEQVDDPVPLISRPGVRRFAFARETRPCLVDRRGVLYLAYFGLTTSNDWKLVLLRGDDISKLVPLSVLDLDPGAPKSLAMCVADKHVLCVWSDNRGVVRAWRRGL